MSGVQVLHEQDGLFATGGGPGATTKTISFAQPTSSPFPNEYKDRAALVIILHPTGNVLSGVTFDGVAMNLLMDDHEFSVYWLVGVPEGTVNVDVNFSAYQFYIGGYIIQSYHGVSNNGDYKLTVNGAVPQPPTSTTDFRAEIFPDELPAPVIGDAVVGILALFNKTMVNLYAYDLYGGIAGVAPDTTVFPSPITVTDAVGSCAAYFRDWSIAHPGIPGDGGSGWLYTQSTGVPVRQYQAIIIIKAAQRTDHYEVDSATVELTAAAPALEYGYVIPSAQVLMDSAAIGMDANCLIPAAEVLVSSDGPDVTSGETGYWEIASGTANGVPATNFKIHFVNGKITRIEV